MVNFKQLKVSQAKAHTGVDVAEEDIAENPEAHRVISNKAAEAVLGAIGDGAEAESVLRDREVLALNRDRDAVRDRVAGDAEGSLSSGAARVLGAGDLVVDGLDGSGVAVDEGGAGVDDRVSGVALVDGAGGVRASAVAAAHLDAVELDLPVAGGGDRGVGKVTGNLALVDTAEVELRAALEEGESELRRANLLLLDEGLEDRGCLVLRDLFEGHAHQAIRRELLGAETIRVLLRSTDALVGRGESTNGDSVGVNLARDGRAIAILERELLAEVLSSAALGGIVGSVA